MSYVKIIKEEPFKLKAAIDWENISKAVDCRGTEYKISKNKDNTVRLIGDKKDENYPIDIAIPLLDIYDNNGNKVSSMDDYE